VDQAVHGKNGSRLTLDMARDLRPTLLAATVAILYGAAALYRSLHHVFWLDEWSVWLTSAMHRSVGDVIHAVRYDGHPPIWYVLLHGLARVWPDPRVAKIAHVAIASGTVYLIWRYGRFSLAEKILLPLGYFFFFEYSTITRSYAPAVMLALVGAAMFPSAGRRPIGYALLLFLIGQWSVFGMVLATALAAGVGIQWIEARPAGWRVAAAIFIASIVLFYVSTRTPPDGTGNAIWMNDWRHLDPAKAAASLFDAYAPIPKITLHWWNTQAIALPNIVRGAMGLAIFAFFAVRLKTREARAILLVGTAAVLAIIFLIYAGSLRHWGHCFIVLVLAMWIERQIRGRSRSGMLDCAFAALLVVQAVGGMMAAALDWRQPFSSSPRAAEVIRAAGANLPVAGDFDYVIVPLAGELNRPIWFLRSNLEDWTVRYDIHRKRNVTLRMISDQVRALAERNHSDVLLVMTYAAPLPAYFEQIAQIPPATIPEEAFWIYKYRWKRGTPNE
jgi:hypothetical protein